MHDLALRKSVKLGWENATRPDGRTFSATAIDFYCAIEFQFTRARDGYRLIVFSRAGFHRK